MGRHYVIILTVVLVLAAALLAVSVPGSSGAITAAADKFRTPPGWELQSETVESPRLLCRLVTSPCPSIERVWEAVDRSDVEMLAALLAAGGAQDIRADSKCLDPEEGAGDLCSAQGSVDGFTAAFTLRAGGDGSVEAILRVRRLP